MMHKFAWVLVAVFAGMTLAWGDDDRTVGRAIVGEKTESAHTGNLGAGLIFEVEDQEGRRGLYSVDFEASEKAVVRTVYTDGTDEIREIEIEKFIEAEVGVTLGNPSVEYVEVLALQNRKIYRQAAPGNWGAEVVTTTALAFRFNRNPAVPFEIRLYDVNIDWDLVGRSVDDRALRVGFGAGFNQFVGRWDAVRDERPWGMGVLYPRVSAVFAFTPSIRAEGALEVFPLFRAGKMAEAWGGSLARGSGSLSWDLAKRVRAFVEVLYERAAFTVPGTGHVDERDDFFFGQGGVKVTW